MRKIWDKITALVYKVPYDKLLHFTFGAIIAAFFVIVLYMKFCFCAALFLAFVKEFFVMWTGDEFNVGDFLSMLVGALVIQLFVLI